MFHIAGAASIPSYVKQAGEVNNRTDKSNPTVALYCVAKTARSNPVLALLRKGFCFALLAVVVPTGSVAAKTKQP